MSVGRKDHRGVAETIAVALGRLYEPLDLPLGQVLTGPQVPVGEPGRGDCSFYSAWRDQL